MEGCPEGKYPERDSWCVDLHDNSHCWCPPGSGASNCYPTEDLSNNFIAIRNFGSDLGSVLYAEYQKGDQQQQPINFDNVDFHEWVYLLLLLGHSRGPLCTVFLASLGHPRPPLTARPRPDSTTTKTPGRSTTCTMPPMPAHWQSCTQSCRHGSPARAMLAHSRRWPLRRRDHARPGGKYTTHRRAPEAPLSRPAPLRGCTAMARRSQLLQRPSVESTIPPPRRGRGGREPTWTRNCTWYSGSTSCPGRCATRGNWGGARHQDTAVPPALQRHANDSICQLPGQDCCERAQNMKREASRMQHQMGKHAQTLR